MERLPPGEGAEDDPDFGVIRDWCACCWPLRPLHPPPNTCRGVFLPAAPLCAAHAVQRPQVLPRLLRQAAPAHGPARPLLRAASTSKLQPPRFVAGVQHRSGSCTQSPCPLALPPHSGFGGSDNDSDFDPDLEDEEGSGDDESWGDGSESAGLSSDGEDYNPWGGQGSTSDDDEGW